MERPDSSGFGRLVHLYVTGHDAIEALCEESVEDLDDAFEFFLSDDAGTTVVHLGVAASGATWDSLIRFAPLPKDPQLAKAALSGKGEAPEEDASWNGAWTAAVHLEKERFAMEIAIPWAMLRSA